MTYSATKFGVATSNSLGGVHLQENTLFDLDIGVKVTGNVAQYPLHHVTYSATKFEVARSNVLGVDSDIYKNVTGGRMTGRLWYEINIPFFLKKKTGIKRQ